MISILIEWWCRGIFRYSSVNVVFEIYYFPIFICDALVFMKICPVPTDANCFWSIAKPFFLLMAFYNCNVHVWELSWRLTILFPYGFEYLINVIRKPRWSLAQNVEICCFQAYQNNLLEHLLSWHMGLCVFSLHISFVAIMIICEPFYYHHQIRRMNL